MKLNCLQSLKGIVAIIIATGHFFYWQGEFSVYPLSFILGVEFFFILSGFLLTMSIYKNQSMSSLSYAKRFIKNRFINLYIPYIFLGLAWFIIFDSPNNFYDLTIILTLSQAMGFSFGGDIFGETIFGIAWCLSLEFYIGFIYFLIVRKYMYNKVNIIFSTIIISYICLLILITYSPDYMNVHYYEFLNLIPMGFFGILLGYSLGLIMYFIKLRLQNINIDNKKILFSFFEILIVLLLIYIYARVDYNRINEFIAPIYISILILIFSFESGILSSTLKSKILTRIGDISIYIYMLHPFVIRVYKHYSFGINHYFSYIVLVIVLSIILSIFISKLKIYFTGKLYHKNINF